MKTNLAELLLLGDRGGRFHRHQDCLILHLPLVLNLPGPAVRDAELSTLGWSWRGYAATRPAFGVGGEQMPSLDAMVAGAPRILVIARIDRGRVCCSRCPWLGVGRE